MAGMAANPAASMIPGDAMQHELPDTPAPAADLPTAEIITYAQFLSARSRRALDQARAGNTGVSDYPWAYTFEPRP